MKSYRSYAPTQAYLLPPSPTEWLPEGHLAYFILDVVQRLDLRPIESAVQAKDPRGERHRGCASDVTPATAPSSRPAYRVSR